MQNWKLNLDLEHFININEDSLFFQDDFNFSYSDLRDQINSLNLSMQDNAVLFLVSKKITFLEIAHLLALLLNNHQVLLASSQIGQEKIQDFQKLVDSINSDKQKLVPGILLPTSGSSSSPKIYFFELKKILMTAISQANALNILACDRISCTLPIYHVSGLMLIFRAIVSGATLIQHDLNHHDSFTGIDHISLVPTQLLKFKSNHGSYKKLSHLKSVTVGGALVSDQLKKELTNEKIKFFESYGATETLGFAILNNQLMPHLEMILTNEHAPVFYGENLPDFFYQNHLKILTLHHLNGIQLNDQLLKTTSISYGEEKVHYQFLKRLDLIFQSAAENISPLEIEETLNKYFVPSSITEDDLQFSFIITKYPDPEYQWIPILTIILSKEIDSKKLEIFQLNCEQIFEQHLLPLKRPRYIDFQISAKFFEEKIGRSQIEKTATIHLLEKLFDCSFQKKNQQHSTLIFHGFMGEKVDFAFLNESSSNKFDFVLTTLPWHQNNPLNNFFFRNTSAIIAQTTYLIRSFANMVESYSLLGYSMGGRLLLQAILDIGTNHPETLKTLRHIIFISTGWGLKSVDEKRQRKILDDQLFNGIQNTLDLEKFYQDWYQQALFGGSERLNLLNDNNEQKAHKNYSLIPVFKEALLKFGQSQFPTEQENLNTMSEIQSNCLKNQNHHMSLVFISGEKDQKYLELAASLVNRLNSQIKLNPKAQHYVVTSAYHDPHKSHPTEITKILSKLRLVS